MAVEKRYAELFCFDYPNRDANGNIMVDENGNTLYFRTIRNFYFFGEVFNPIGYSAWPYKNNVPSIAMNRCMVGRDDVFVFIGHGAPGAIAFYNDEGEVRGVIAVRDLEHLYVGIDNAAISSISSNGLALARIIFYLGCETGVPFNPAGTNFSYNLVDETFEKGAHFVLGCTEILYNTHTDEWLEYFLDLIDNGFSVGAAIDGAKTALGRIEVRYDNAFGEEEVFPYEEIPLYCRGDQSQYLNMPS